MYIYSLLLPFQPTKYPTKVSTYGGEYNNQGSMRRKMALFGLCSFISTITVGPGVQHIHMYDTDIAREMLVPSIQQNQEKVIKIMVKITVGKTPQLITGDFIACERH